MVFYNFKLFNSDFDAFEIENGYFKKIGYKSDFKNLDVDLENKYIIPSFIDSHSHILSVAFNNLFIDLLNLNINEILEKINNSNLKLIKCINLNLNEFDELINEINKLDKVVIINHLSNHLCITNNSFNKLYNLNSNLHYEDECININKLIQMPDIIDIINSYKLAINTYKENGFIIAQEGMLVKEMLPIYKEILKSNILDIDVYGYVNYFEIDLFNEFKKLENKHFKIKGIKVILDGSPQLKTAYMKHNYLNSCSNGLLNISDDILDDAFKKAIELKTQIIIHSNGSKACKMVIDKAIKYKDYLNIIRPVIIHGQFIDKADIIELDNFTISYFVNHIKHYFDVHKSNLGDLAYDMSPIKSSINKVNVTIHQDSPVIMPNMIESLECAVKRLSNSGEVVNESEKINIKEALDLTNINSAIMYNEPNLGKIEEGYKANFLVLDKEIDSFKSNVLRSYKDGILIYKRD